MHCMNKNMLDLIDTLQDCYLFQHVTEPTRYRDGERPNLLDLILSTEERMVHNLTYHPPLGETDHLCLKFNVMLSQYMKKDCAIPAHNIQDKLRGCERRTSTSIIIGTKNWTIHLKMTMMLSSTSYV